MSPAVCEATQMVRLRIGDRKNGSKMLFSNNFNKKKLFFKQCPLVLLLGSSLYCEKSFPIVLSVSEPGFFIIKSVSAAFLVVDDFDENAIFQDRALRRASKIGILWVFHIL